MIPLSSIRDLVERATCATKGKPRNHSVLRLAERYDMGPEEAMATYERHLYAILRGDAALLPNQGQPGSNVYLIAEGKRPNRRVFYPVTKLCRTARNNRKSDAVPLIVTYLNSTMIFENYSH